MQSGVIAAEEKDYGTAYSYFYESYEGYNSLTDPTAARSLKYMLLCKIMDKKSDDALNILNSQITLKYQSTNLDAMKAVALAVKEQSLQAFEKAKETFSQELTNDFILKTHINNLYQDLLESNLLKILLPYSEVQVEYVAQ